MTLMNIENVYSYLPIQFVGESQISIHIVYTHYIAWKPVMAIPIYNVVRLNNIVPSTYLNIKHSDFILN